MTQRTALYRFFTAAGDLLYIGIACDPDQRQKGHARTASKTWYPIMTQRTDTWYETRSEAEVAEADAINGERPPWNSRYTSVPLSVSREPRPPRSRQAEAVAESRADRWRRTEGFRREARRVGLSIPQLVAAKVRDAIACGQYAVGDRIPTALDLGRKYGLDSGTILTGLKPLKEEGLLESRHGRGTIVRRLPEAG